jgi:hypothetical protein
LDGSGNWRDGRIVNRAGRKLVSEVAARPRRATVHLALARGIGVVGVALAASILCCGDRAELPNEPVILDNMELHYAGARCFAVIPAFPAPAQPADRVDFECGAVVVDFLEGTRLEDVEDLPQSMGAEGGRWSIEGDAIIGLTVFVDVGAEKAAIEIARRHPLVTLASLNFLMAGNVLF